VIDCDWVNQQPEHFNAEFASSARGCLHPWYPGLWPTAHVDSPACLHLTPLYHHLLIIISRELAEGKTAISTLEAQAPLSKGKRKAVDSLEEQPQKKRGVAASALKLKQKLRENSARYHGNAQELLAVTGALGLGGCR